MFAVVAFFAVVYVVKFTLLKNQFCRRLQSVENESRVDSKIALRLDENSDVSLANAAF